MIRAFDLLDLPTLHRYRHDGLCLDNALALTWGMTMVPAGALLTYLPLSTGVFTYLVDGDEEGDPPALAQAIHSAGTSCGRLTFLAPESALGSHALAELLDHLAMQVGERGAHNLLAEVDESTRAYEVLRRAGFAIYARQRIWKTAGRPDGGTHDRHWRAAVSQDAIAVRALYNVLVPGLVHQVEPLAKDRLRGMVYYAQGSLLGYADLSYGPMGVMVHPLIHPDVEQVVPCLKALFRELPNRLARTVYACARSYQAWLEPGLEDLEAQPGPRQAVMVKRLAVPLERTVEAMLPSIQGTRANPTVPIVRTPPARVQSRVAGRRSRPVPLGRDAR